MTAIAVFLEIGQKKAIASAAEWPGWCRAAKTEAEALAALVAYAPRYAPVAAGAGLDFSLPASPTDLAVVERLAGDASTDFGVPGRVAQAERGPLAEDDEARLLAVWNACFDRFVAAARAAEGKPLRKGPRGGGRELEKISEHVLGAEAHYLATLGWPVKLAEVDNHRTHIAPLRAAACDGLAAARRGEIAPTGPRGGKRWPPRYYLRRSGWHLLDHAWELEDRIEG
jgi:hypothetical protein